MSHFAMPEQRVNRTRFGPNVVLGWVLLLSVIACMPLLAADPVTRQSDPITSAQSDDRHAGSSSRAISSYNWNVNSTAEGRVLIAKDPTDPVNYIRAGLAAYNQGAPEEALQTLEVGRRNAAPSALLLLALGALYIEVDRLTAASEATAAALDLEPNNVDAHVQLGDINRRNRMYQNAVAAYRQALDRDELHPAAQTGLVYSLIATGQASEGEQECRLFLTSDVGRANLWLALGEAQEQQQKLHR